MRSVYPGAHICQTSFYKRDGGWGQSLVRATSKFFDRPDAAGSSKMTAFVIGVGVAET